MADTFRPGEHYLISDRSGRKIRASEARKEWTGNVVHKDEWEPRQAQDLVRGKVDKLAVDDPRPRPPDVFIGPLATLVSQNASAGDHTLHLESAVRMRASDKLWIMLDDGRTFLTTIQSVTNETDIILTDALPWPASIGNRVTDNTAMAQPELP